MNSGTPRTVQRGIVTLLAAFCVVASALSQAIKPQHAQLSLISTQVSGAPDTSKWIGLRFQLEPGWHIYWTNPGDSGEPPKVTWHLPEGVKAGDLQFPTPRRIRDHGLMDYGYEGQVVLLSKLTIPASSASKKGEIGADVRYLACREVCVPGKAQLSLAPSSGDVKESAGLIESAEAKLPQPLPRDVHVSAVSDKDSFVVTVADKRKILGTIRDFIPSDPQSIDNVTMPVVQESAGLTHLRLKKSEQLHQSVSTLRGLLIAGDKAYNATIPVAASKTSSSKTGSNKTLFQKTQAYTKTKE